MKIRALVLVSLLALCLAPAAFGQVIEKETVNTAVTGKVTAIDEAAGTITVKGANKDGGTFVVDSDTTLMSGAENIKLKDLKVGWHVVLDADQKGDIQRATYIEVVDGGD